VGQWSFGAVGRVTSVNLVALTDLFRLQDMKKPRLEFESDVANFIQERRTLINARWNEPDLARTLQRNRKVPYNRSALHVGA
jgi:hypothetical protein